MFLFIWFGRTKESFLAENVLTSHYQKIMHFIRYARTYLIKKNPLKELTKDLTGGIKDFLTMNKKLKMARYRVNYQKYKLAQFEKLIAQNNEHVFLRGRTLNETR